MWTGTKYMIKGGWKKGSPGLLAVALSYFYPLSIILVNLLNKMICSKDLTCFGLSPQTVTSVTVFIGTLIFDKLAVTS